MQEISPAGQESIDFYQTRVEEYGRIADACGIPSFSNDLRRDLSALSLDGDAIRLIEAVARIGNYRDTADIATMRKAVSRNLKARGVRLPRGKRASPGLSELVADLAPIFLYFGFPLASSERSRLVKGLRMIAEELDVPGDPRSEVRRLIRITRTHQAATRKMIFEAIAQGLAPLRVHPPPISSSQPER